MHTNTATKVLIADDNVDAGEMLGAYLEVMGLEVCVVHDGAAAVQRAREIEPDLIILDLGMPLVDGWEACRQIRSLPGGDEVRIVALSGWGSDEARARSAQAGFNLHWTKPTAVETILKVLK